MKLTIQNFDKHFKIRNWEVYECQKYDTHYNFFLCDSNDTNKYVVVIIKREPTMLSQKVEVCFEVKIAYDTYGNVFYTEDVTLTGLKDKNIFWNAVENMIVNKIQFV